MPLRCCRSHNDQLALIEIGAAIVVGAISSAPQRGACGAARSIVPSCVWRGRE